MISDERSKKEELQKYCNHHVVIFYTGGKRITKCSTVSGFCSTCGINFRATGKKIKQMSIDVAFQTDTNQKGLDRWAIDNDITIKYSDL